MKQTKHHQTLKEDRVPLFEKIIYGMGASVRTIMGTAPNQLAPLIMTIGLGVSPALVGLSLTIPRIWDAVTDPLLGTVSDNSEFKMGRRRPFILAGALLAGVVYMLMWRLPAGFSETGYFWYFLLMLILFFTCSTIYSVPYTALGYEMSRDYHERTRVMAAASVFIALGGFFVPWLFALSELPRFGDRVNGARHVAVYVGLFFAVVGIIPALFCRERFVRRAQAHKKMPFLKSIRTAFANKPFLILAASAFSMLLFALMVNTLGPYINIYYVYGGDTQEASVMIGIAGSAYYTCYLLFTPLISWVSVHFGKKRTIFGIYLLTGFVCLLKWPLYTPVNPWLQLIPNGLMAMGWCANNILIQSMIADVCDVDEWENGARREGIFGAVFSWITKTGWSVTNFISGLVLVWTGFDVSLGAEQSVETLTTMRAAYAFVPAVGMLIPLVLISFYPLSEDRVYEIRKLLKERNSAIEQ